jgi:hypothetical protein
MHNPEDAEIGVPTPVAPTPEGGEMEPEIEEHPRGTFVIMMIYLVIIIGLWGAIYIAVLQRR